MNHPAFQALLIGSLILPSIVMVSLLSHRAGIRGAGSWTWGWALLWSLGLTAAIGGVPAMALNRAGAVLCALTHFSAAHRMTSIGSKGRPLVPIGLTIPGAILVGWLMWQELPDVARLISLPIEVTLLLSAARAFWKSQLQPVVPVRILASLLVAAAGIEAAILLCRVADAIDSIMALHFWAIAGPIMAVAQAAFLVSQGEKAGKGSEAAEVAEATLLRERPASEGSIESIDPSLEPIAMAPKNDQKQWEALASQLVERLEQERWYLDPGMTLDVMARKLGTNSWSLSRTINAGLGCNFNELINGYRVEAAKRLLDTEPEKSILDIGFDCGFASKTSFNRSFKKLAGVSPRVFRDSMKNSDPTR